MKKRMKRIGLILTGFAVLTVSACGQQESGAYEQAMEALEAGSYVLAQQEFEEAEQTEDRPAEVARGEGILCLALGQYEEALEHFEEAVEYAGKNNKSFIQDVNLYQAEAYIALEQYEDASALCQKLLDGSSAGKAELLLGRIALEQNDVTGAAEHFTASVEAEQSFENYLTIYDLYADVSMEADGAVYLEQALELIPQDADDYCSQGQVYYNLGDLEQAKTSYARAIDLGSTDAVPLMGQLYLDNGEISAARSMYQSYLSEAVQPAIAYNGLALCDMAEQDYDAALANISSGLEEEDASVRESLLLNEIACYEYKLDFETAKEKMEAFLAEYPDNEDAVRENIFLQSR